MSDSFFDKFIADLVKGAEANSRANGGPGVNILVDRENRGREEKLAGHSGIGAAVGGPVGAALGADKGQEMAAAKGSFMGGLKGLGIGGLAGGGLGALLPLLAGESPSLGAALGGAGLGGALGSYAGSIGGAAHAGDKPPGLLDRMKGGSLEACYIKGIKAAAATFGIKESMAGLLAAALPMAGSLLGGTAARAGVGALARGAGGSAISGMAGKMLPKMTGGIGGAATDMLGSMAGGAVGQKLAPKPPQQPQPPGM